MSRHSVNVLQYSISDAFSCGIPAGPRALYGLAGVLVRELSPSEIAYVALDYSNLLGRSLTVPEIQPSSISNSIEPLVRGTLSAINTPTSTS